MSDHGTQAKPATASAPATSTAVPVLEASVQKAGDGLIGSWRLSDDGVVRSDGTVTLTGHAGLAVPPVQDWALYAALPAMVARGGRVRLRGTASRRALADAAEIARAWASLNHAAHPVILDADDVVDGARDVAQDRAVVAAAPGGQGIDAVPPGLTVAFVVGGAAGPGEVGPVPLSLGGEWQDGPAPRFFGATLRRVSGLHLLAGEARIGFLRIEPAETPRLGGPAAPAQAASFLSGAMEVIPVLSTGERFVPRTTLSRPMLAGAPGPVVAHFEQTVRDGATRRALILEGLSDRPAGERVTMWWEMPGEPDLPTPPVLDQMVAAVALPALVRGQDLVVRGPMSRLASLYLPRLVATRAAWGAPAPGGPIAIMPDQVLDPPAPAGEPKAILTFSGGVDSFHSFLWRTSEDAPPAEPKLAAAVLSLGFDFPLEQKAAFEAHRARIAPVLEKRGVRLHVVHSNSRALGLVEWDLAAVPMIVAAMSQFAHRYAWGLIGGARPYPDLKLPIISPPLLDRALTGNWFSVATEASGLGRTERVARVARDAEASAVLRVCYDEHSPDFSRNCCECPKCRRTMLNFLAVGVAKPACFDRVPPPEELAEVPMYKADDPLLLGDLAAYARAHGTAGAWTDRVEERIAAWRPSIPLTRATWPRWVAEKAAIWGGRMLKDPIGTPALAWRKLAARIEWSRR